MGRIPHLDPDRGGAAPAMAREALGDGWVAFDPAFVEDHAAWMARLVDELPLRQESLVLFGRPVATPRLTSWHGDPGARYRYSGRTFEPSPWTPTLASLRDRLEARTGVAFNSALANLYRDGADSMGAHADDEPELGPRPDDKRIASISLGAPRRFVLRARDGSARREWSLGEGSLLVMGGRLQEGFVHHVPKTRRPVGPRLNLTFRVVTVAAAP